MKDKPLEALPMKTDVKKFVLTGLMTAMVFVLTFTLKVPVPYTSGYIHLGDSMIYLSVIVLGPCMGHLRRESFNARRSLGRICAIRHTHPYH
jgi:hypothetical protein